MFPPEAIPDGVLTVAQAMARYEGWYAHGTVPNRPQRNNNPGDLEFKPWQTKHGAIHGDPRFAIFNTAQGGWDAFNALLENDYRGKTMAQIIAEFAPAIENEVDKYLAAVCHWSNKQQSDIPFPEVQP